MSLPKPAIPVLNLGSPFAQGLVLVVPFTEGSGVPAVLPASLGVTLTAVGSPTWATNSAGIAGQFLATGDGWRSAAESSWMPTAAMTMAVIKRKLDATNRQETVMSPNGGGTWGGTASLMLLLPFNDGTTYWDYGGVSGANRLTAPGLTYSQGVPDLWVVTAGSAGSAIWQNGVKVANQATGITRVNSVTDQFFINGSYNEAAAQGDICQINFLQINNAQWDDATITAWFANPYAMLYAPSGRHSAFGAQKPTRRRMHV